MSAEDQRIFGEAFAQRSGLSYRVVEAWLLHEQGPGSPSAPGSNNWLNIGYEDSGPNTEYWRIGHMESVKAGVESANWLARQSNFAGIIASRGRGDAAEAQAIIDSPWASSHYGHVSPAAFLSAASGVLNMGHGRARVNVGPVGVHGHTTAPGYRPVVNNTGNPQDHSQKTKVSGEQLGRHGSNFYSAVGAMRALTARHVPLRLPRRR